MREISKNKQELDDKIRDLIEQFVKKNKEGYKLTASCVPVKQHFEDEGTVIICIRTSVESILIYE